MASHPPDAIQDILDMSNGPDNLLHSFIVYVGPQRRKFMLLGQLLNLKRIDLDHLIGSPGTSTDEIWLEKVDPEAFNLFAQWLYGIGLPRVQKTWLQTKQLDINDGIFQEIPSPEHLAGSGALASDLMYPKEGGYMQKFTNIVSHPSYIKFSPEEIRLADMIRMSDALINTEQRGAVTKQKDAAVSPAVVLEAGALEAEANSERIQTILLKLVLLAEKARWHQCFNDALSNYRHGERQLSRVSPQPDHIDMAYSSIRHDSKEPASDFSPTLHFMADYAYFKGVEHRQLTAYQPLFSKYPRFLRDIQLRETGTMEVPGVTKLQRFGLNAQILTEFLHTYRSPLDDLEGRYMLHGEACPETFSHGNEVGASKWDVVD
ncbi:hypothetical protein PG995_001939 [Apiospora arundinis]|uniref:BTB domain-containing protein n=1 Tax=Apiospora arundinis TaxID=335852 RepID=A0ABR2J707_9PEZI